MGAYNRIDRISEEVKKELSLVVRELKDPRLNSNMISVVNVTVTKDSTTPSTPGVRLVSWSRWCRWCFICCMGATCKKSQCSW